MTTPKETVSIIHERVDGMVLVSGLHKRGKTTFALGLENPARTVLVDFDFKAAGAAKSLGVLAYARPEIGGDDVLGYDSKKLLDWFRAYCKDELLPLKGQVSHLILDNATYLIDAFDWEVRKNPRKYGVRADNASSGSYGGTSPGVRKIWAQTILWFQKEVGIKVVTVINHMSQPWAKGAPIANKFKITGGKAFRQLCILAVVMVPGDHKRGGKPPKPSAVVLGEQLAHTYFDEGKGEVITARALPARLPVAEWPRIKDYFDTPADFANPAPGETWSTFEAAAYDEWMTPEQLEWVKNMHSYSEETVGQGSNGIVMADKVMLDEIRVWVKRLKTGTETDAQINTVLKSAKVKALDKLTATEANAALERIKAAVKKAADKPVETTTDTKPAETTDKEPVKAEDTEPGKEEVKHWAATDKSKEFNKFCKEMAQAG